MRNAFKFRRRTGYPFHLLKIIQIIGSNTEGSTRFERRVDRIEKFSRDDSPPMMTALRPRIRKEEVKCFDRRFRNQIPDGISALDFENANIVKVSRLAGAF